MVSLDSAEKNAEFAKSLEARHVLLSDPEKQTAKAFGVLALGGLYAKRWTYYIDRDGVVQAIDKDVSVETAGQDIAAKLEALGFRKRAD